MKRRTWLASVAGAALGAIGITKAGITVQIPPCPGKWYSVSKGDTGAVYDGDGIKQDYITDVWPSTGDAVRLKRAGGHFVVTDGGHVVREKVRLKMPVRYIPN